MHNLVRMVYLMILLLLFVGGCGDDSNNRKYKGIQPIDRSCCPEPEQAILCGQCTLEKPCFTQKPFVSLVCNGDNLWYLQYAYPATPVTYSYIMAPTKGIDGCCPEAERGIYQFWCLPEMPCRSDNAWLSIYYEPDLLKDPGWKLLELLPENNKTIWSIYVP